MFLAKMFITTDDSCFTLKNFAVHTFYGEQTCFCWNADKLVVFPYMNSDPKEVQILTPPAPVNGIRCHSSRIFVICIPHGIYKLSRDRQFAVLSKSAVGMGCVYYEVLIPRNKYLHLDNKQTFKNKLLFQLSSEKICTYPLNIENAQEELIQIMTESESIENICIIADGKKLYKLVNGTVRIIHSNICVISDIIPIRKGLKIAGLLLLTNTDTITAMYVRDQKLAFEQICLHTKVKAICSSFSQQMRDALWIVYCDESKLYYAKKQLLVDDVHRMNVQEKSFTCLQCYDSKVILGLTKNKQLLEFSTDAVEKALSVENDTFINLNSNMLKGANFIMDKIYQGTQELHKLNEILMAEEDILRRINLYAHKQRIRTLPHMLVHRITNQLHLSVNFQNVLPQNSQIICSIQFKCQIIFCTKKVADSESTVDIHIPKDKVSITVDVPIDLVTLTKEGAPWCLIRNYINDPLSEQNRKTRSKVDKSSFINAKILILRKLIAEGCTDMKKLSEIKRSIRKEFGNS